MDPEEPCKCGHQRKWHDSCSRCFCPVFLPLTASARDVKVWRALRKLREAEESD